ncbi:Paladin [Takifugu flavidus]|uniref:Paladin n=1 Tax=Takifugu flavidus TaxID=433684 RepID=A0A5C6PQ08_9TELE|nr:Paladin [Takifugu flavidus]
MGGWVREERRGEERRGEERRERRGEERRGEEREERRGTEHRNHTKIHYTAGLDSTFSRLNSQNLLSTIKSAKTEKESQPLLLNSLQYLERYIYLILFNTYLHLEKKNSWQRSFTLWMEQVAARAGVYDVLNQLGFSEFEDPRDTPLARLRYRWQQHTTHTLPFRGEFI